MVRRHRLAESWKLGQELANRLGETPVEVGRLRDAAGVVEPDRGGISRRRTGSPRRRPPRVRCRGGRSPFITCRRRAGTGTRRWLARSLSNDSAIRAPQGRRGRRSLPRRMCRRRSPWWPPGCRRIRWPPDIGVYVSNACACVGVHTPSGARLLEWSALMLLFDLRAAEVIDWADLLLSQRVLRACCVCRLHSVGVGQGWSRSVCLVLAGVVMRVVCAPRVLLRTVSGVMCVAGCGGVLLCGVLRVGV